KRRGRSLEQDHERARVAEMAVRQGFRLGGGGSGHVQRERVQVPLDVQADRPQGDADGQHREQPHEGPSVLHRQRIPPMTGSVYVSEQTVWGTCAYRYGGVDGRARAIQPRTMQLRLRTEPRVLPPAKPTDALAKGKLAPLK